MKHKLAAFHKACAMLALAAAAPLAQAAYSCSMNATNLNGTYVASASTNLAGTLTLNCTRASGDASNMTYFIELDNGATTGSRRIYRHGGINTTADRLSHSVSRTGFGGTTWSTGSNRVTGTLSFGTTLFASASFPYYFRVASGQTGRRAGIFDDILTFSMRQTSAGAIVATTTFTPTVSIVSQCFVGQVGTGYAAPGATDPSTLTLDYTSFSPAALTSSMSFTVDCTLGTPYTLALSPSSGTLLGLPYSLSLSGTSATGAGLAQSYTVTGDIAAGLPGTCSVASCSATQPTTVTITY